MSSYHAYPEYRDSGIEWLGGIPIEWNLIYGRRAFNNRREAPNLEDEQLSASQMYGVVPQALMMAKNKSKVMLALKGTAGFRHVEKDDFVISLRSFEGGIEHSLYEGCVSPAYTVLQPLVDISPEYFRYLFKSSAYISALQATTDSLRDGKSITYEQFGSIGVSVPPVLEQRSIANFLDHETAKIDTLIEKQQQLIKLLKEKRQAVISHAVTKGLNPDAPMKDSGVEWLGEVPEGWVGTEIRYITTQLGGGTPSKDNSSFWDGDIPWVSPKDMKVAKIRETVDNISPEAVSKSSAKLVPIGSVLIVVRGMILVHSVPVALNTVPVTINQDMKGLVPKESLDGEFLLYLLKGLRDLILDFVETSAHGTKCLRTEDLERMQVFLPSLEMQSELIEFIEQRVFTIDSLINKAESASKLLLERRTALISAAVTGKIDVRNWQPPKATSTPSTDA